MDRYAYYLLTCKLECRLPIGRDYFRLQFLDCILAQYPELPVLEDEAEWFDEIPECDKPIVELLARQAPSEYNQPTLADYFTSAWGKLFNRQQSANGEDRPDDGPIEGGSSVREPRRPLTPLLSGSAGRSYPPTDPPNWAAM